MDIKNQFEKAILDSEKLPKRPDNSTLLKIYSLFKQAKFGNAPEQELKSSNFVEKAKRKAWQKLKDKPSEECMEEYITLIESLKD